MAATKCASARQLSEQLLHASLDLITNTAQFVEGQFDRILDQPVDLGAAAKYEEIIRAMMVRVANGDQRPQWKQDSFFRRYASGN